MDTKKMLLAAICIAVTPVIPVLLAAPSFAHDYPFCRKGEAGPGDCRYETLEQCQAAVSGTAAYCQPNYWLLPASREIPPRRVR